MKKALYRIYVCYGSPGDEFPFARTMYDVMFPILTELEQREIVNFGFNDGLDGHQITEERRAKFHEDAYSFRPVQFWIGEVRRGREDPHDTPRPGRPSNQHIAATIQQLFKENPFESRRSIAETLQI
jgi:hypothetical protein